MRFLISKITVLSTILMLSACGPSAVENDPNRVEFVDACMEMKAYQSKAVEKRNSLCTCTYDAAMRDLSEDEKNAARFYLFGQAGIDTASKDLLSNPPDMNVILKASNSIGEAVKQCR